MFGFKDIKYFVNVKAQCSFGTLRTQAGQSVSAYIINVRIVSVTAAIYFFDIEPITLHIYIHSVSASGQTLVIDLQYPFEGLSFGSNTDKCKENCVQ